MWINRYDLTISIFWSIWTFGYESDEIVAYFWKFKTKILSHLRCEWFGICSIRRLYNPCIFHISRTGEVCCRPHLEFIANISGGLIRTDHSRWIDDHQLYLFLEFSSSICLHFEWYRIGSLIDVELPFYNRRTFVFESISVSEIPFSAFDGPITDSSWSWCIENDAHLSDGGTHFQRLEGTHVHPIYQ